MNFFKTFALLTLLTGLLVLIGYIALGNILGAVIGLSIAATFNFLAWFYSDQAALTFYDAKPPTPAQAKLLEPMLKRLCQRADLPLPKLYVVPTSTPNAFATGRDPHHAAVAVTQGLLDLLSVEEIEGVIAHELSHIKHRDTLTLTIAATLAGGIALLADFGKWGSFRQMRLNPTALPGLLLTLMVAPMAALLLQMSISRSREFAADAGAAQLTGNPEALATSLEKLSAQKTQRNSSTLHLAFSPLLIVNPFAGGWFAWFSTHPPTAARVAQLRSRKPHSKATVMKTPQSRLVRRSGLSIGIFLAALGLTYAPLPGLNQTVVVVSGTELQEPLQALEAKFEQTHPQIQLDLKFQGSQDLVNRYIDAKNDFTPTVLIPANGELIADLGERWQAQNGSEPFYELPQPIAKTSLVAIAWADRGKVLFPNQQFDWNRLEQALQKGDWGEIGGPSDWGSFDLLITDPTRSNSAQLTLGLWAESQLGSSVTASSLNSPNLDALFSLVKRSVYQPPRSTDTLLQEFIARGPNQADVATVYESIALHRWQQSAASQAEPYQIYYINPTVETVSTAAIVRRDVSQNTANAARQFLDFLTAPEQQQVFVQYGFRPVNPAVDIQSTPNSPWMQNIPGAEITPPGVASPPDQATLSEIVRLWQRAQ